MALQNKEMNLVLSSDAKPRLKWTPELHQQFVRAVNQLGGIEKATPKSLMRAMGIHGLTLYHLKSHLQKYRLGRNPQSQSHRVNKLKGDQEDQRSHTTNKIPHGGHEQINENLQVVQALQMQMEVQRKLHEQIEVQRHLQLRIEAQGKYLQSVLRKAQETLSGYISCSIEIDCARDQLSQLASMVDSTCPSSSLSVLTESNSLMVKGATDQLLENHLPENSLTSSESSGRMEETQSQHEVAENYKNGITKSNSRKRNSTMLSLMEMHPSDNNESDYQVSIKGGRSLVDGINHTKQATSEKSHVQNSNEQVKRCGALEDIDLNCNSLDDSDSDLKTTDLKLRWNCVH